MTTKQPMRLYDCPRKVWVRILEDVTVPPGAPPLAKGDEVFFHRADGMYSVCNDKAGDLVRLSVMAPVEIIDPPVDAPIEDTFRPAK